MKKIKVFAPATVANLGSGFDLLGLAFDGIGDTVTIYRQEEKGVKIVRIDGYDLPFENDKNIVGYLAEMMLQDAEADFGVHIELSKGIKPGSGIGSSAASAVATVYGINKMLGGIYNENQLLEYAMEGELLVSGGKFADNVAPCLLGGMVLINGYDPISFMQLPVPENLHAVVLHPHIEIKTSESRDLLPIKVDMKDAIKQAKNLGTFIAGLYTVDLEKIARGLEDRLATPYRQKTIPFYDELISGSGPSVFHLCDNEENADKLAHALDEFYQDKDIEYQIYNAVVARFGAREIND